MSLKKTEFLDRYFQLCEEYQMYIDGCGCCDSPFITPLEDTDDSREEFKDHKKHMRDPWWFMRDNDE